MPALILTGHPCTGKTTFASILATRAKTKYGISSTVIINEESSCLDKTKFQCYQSSTAEKSTRSALKAAFDRNSGVAGSTSAEAAAADAGRRSGGGRKNNGNLIILDSLNYIKGYRYELYCISKASGDKHGVVWVRSCDPDLAKRWNRGRNGTSSGDGGDPKRYYTDEIMEGLVARFETPNDKWRWENPLYTVDIVSGDGDDKKDHNDGDDEDDGANKTDDSVGDTPFLSAKRREVLVEAADTILESFLLHAEPLKAGVSTRKHVSAESNMLHDADNIVQRVCTLLVDAQKTRQQVGGDVTLSFGSRSTALAEGKQSSSISIRLNRAVHVPELRRLRRQFVQWVKDHPPDDTTEVGIASSFLSYVETML